MPLSCFMTTLLLRGFDVSFSPIENDGHIESINVAIKKDGLSIQRSTDIPKITTGYGIDDLLYEELRKLYDYYNCIALSNKQEENR